MESTMPVAACRLLLALGLASTVAAFKFNITEILSEFPEFGTFNGLLSKTKIADEINRRQTITVLVVDDSAAGAVTSLPAVAQREVLALQVLLDYYDPIKLDGVKDRTALLTTLFQASGAATGRAGFVNYTQGADDQMAFGSAEPGAPLSSHLVKVVASRPYNLSVMHVSAAIVPPSISLSAAGKVAMGTTSTAPSKVDPTNTEARSVTTNADDLEKPREPSSDTASAPTPGGVDAPASSSPEVSATATADNKATSAGPRVMVGVSAGIGLMGLVVVLMILI